ncbi:MAG TPA: hypothetical protein VHX59_20255 [Mycobacteriales bacterium]|jgi:hypothetical protein|nr:hypothetical protein [Mycobacteriales bacterium]
MPIGPRKEAMSPQLPPAARAIAAAITEAERCASAAEPASFAEAAGTLALLDQSQVRIVLGDLVRMLLEERHPDGLSTDDIRDLLERCSRSAAPWFPAVDPNVLVVVLTGALGMQDPEAAGAPPLAVAQHATLLIADLRAVAGRPLQGYLDSALAEIARAETIEMP